METITVGCKLPNGLIIKVKGKPVTLNGSNSSAIIGGYGLTPVDKDFFEEWKKENANLSLLTNGLIFDQATRAKAESEAKEKQGIRSGLEGIERSTLKGEIEPDKDAPKA